MNKKSILKKYTGQGGPFIKRVRRIIDPIERTLMRGPENDAYEYVLGGKYFPNLGKSPIYGGRNDSIDSLRHAATSMFASSKYGVIPSNLLGLAHEAYKFKPSLKYVKESGSDLYNNFLGSVVGGLPANTEAKKRILKKAANNKFLSTLDGKGGLFSGIKNVLRGGSSTQTFSRAPATPPVNPDPVLTRPPTQNLAPTYDARGLKIRDNDINEAANVLFAEVSNRTPDRQQFEVRNIINTAINRAQVNPRGFGRNLTEVLQKPYQYQGYSPNGTKMKDGNVIQSQYQRVKSGDINEQDKKKLEIIKKTLEEIKTGKFSDTTNGATFYVHASDGTMWLGKTLKEAKDLAHKHELATGKAKTQFGTAIGLPVLTKN